ncbi:hypothetical protein PLEOSDRAFT_1096601 [Pleurotus ostreatus PC15]|uniref:DUF262 domain-containing protein n=1 Tax=Pleurotus ostreatus (strain PC15) TaxID=1137138 RepID=A0A067NMU5_PLEO1|nr:hypothetical protein PLEOSDRAFT_1096601 [Pleurotus ostreatus PC15]
MGTPAQAGPGPSSSSAPPIMTTSTEQLSDLSDADADGEVEHDQLDESEDDDDESSSVLGSDLLNPPKWIKYTTKHLYDMIIQGDIDLDPPYQRALVWSTPKQIKLIDSLFRNFYIPPVVFAVHNDREGGRTRIPYRNEMTKKKWWWKSGIKPESRKILPRLEKDIFEKIELHCVEYEHLDQMTEREIFQRVQLGVALTAAEKLQAIASPWSEWINSLRSKHILIDNGLSVLLAWDTSRARDFQNIAQIVYCCDKLASSVSTPTPSSSKSKSKHSTSKAKARVLPSSARKREVPTPQKIERWLQRTDEPSRVFKRDIDDVLCFMTEVASGGSGGGNGYGYRQKKRRRLVNGFEMDGKRVAPVEFVFIGVLLYVTRDVEDDEWRALSILNLRKRVRGEHTDIRMNPSCARTFWRFIEDLEEDLEQAREMEAEGPSNNKPNHSSVSKTAAKTKNQTKAYLSEAGTTPKLPPFHARPNDSIITSSNVVATPRTQRIAITQTPKRTQSQRQLPTPTSSLKRKRGARDADGSDFDPDVGDRGRGEGDIDMENGGNGECDNVDEDDESPVYYDPDRPVNHKEAGRSRARIINRGWRK